LSGMTKRACTPTIDAECTNFSGADFTFLVVTTLYPIFVSYVVVVYIALPIARSP